MATVGESAWLPQMRPNPVPYAVEFVTGFRHATRIFLGFSGFLPSRETNTSKFQFDQDEGLAWNPVRADVVTSLYIVIL